VVAASLVAAVLRRRGAAVLNRLGHVMFMEAEAGAEHTASADMPIVLKEA
jgi:hypothetical protein